MHFLIHWWLCGMLELNYWWMDPLVKARAPRAPRIDTRYISRVIVNFVLLKKWPGLIVKKCCTFSYYAFLKTTGTKSSVWQEIVAQQQTSKKVKGRTLVIAPLCRQALPQRRSVHGAHQAASHIPALYLPSRGRYSFTDPERMEGWVNPGPGCKEQLAQGCYVTTCGQRVWNPNLAIVSPAR